jgi:hypothetical protein
METTIVQEFYKEHSSKIFTQLLEIVGEDFSFYFINDNLELVVNDITYKPCNFTYIPSEPEAIDSNSQIEIDDIDKKLTYYLQKTTKPIEIKIALIDRDNPSVYIDGPYNNKVSNIKIPSNSLITIELISNNRLSYKIGNSSYNNINFPGLFG